MNGEHLQAVTVFAKSLAYLISHCELSILGQQIQCIQNDKMLHLFIYFAFFMQKGIVTIDQKSYLFELFRYLVVLYTTIEEFIY